MTYIIAQPCIDVKDAACVDVCPVDCIYEGPAIFPDDEVPEEWSLFIAKNYTHFEMEPPT